MLSHLPAMKFYLFGKLSSNKWPYLWAFTMLLRYFTSLIIKVWANEGTRTTRDRRTNIAKEEKGWQRIATNSGKNWINWRQAVNGVAVLTERTKPKQMPLRHCCTRMELSVFMQEIFGNRCVLPPRAGQHKNKTQCQPRSCFCEKAKPGPKKVDYCSHAVKFYFHHWGL